MDHIQIIVAGITILGVFIANAALIIPLFLWNRAEARADIRHMENKLESNRELTRVIHQESRAMIESIREEVKDFHNRLCKIEAERKG